MSGWWRCQDNKVNSRTSCVAKRMYGKGEIFVQAGMNQSNDGAFNHQI